MIRESNFAPYNVGPVLWVNDLAVPLLILILLVVRRHLASTQADAPASNPYDGFGETCHDRKSEFDGKRLLA